MTEPFLLGFSWLRYKLGLRSDVKVKTKITVNMQVSIIFSFKEASFYIDQKI